MQEVFDGQPLLFLALDIEDDIALVHHDQAVPVMDSVPHIMRNHQRGQPVPRDDPLRRI